MFTQLNPTIPVTTEKGKGYAFGVIDYSQEHNLIWVVGLDTGEVWCVSNQDIRLQSNWTLGRQ